MRICSATILCCVALAGTSARIAAAPALTYSVLDKSVPGVSGNSPEDDARPGEYYFMRGVEAFRANDFEHAIKMYEVAASWGYKNAQYNLAVMYARGEGVAQDLPRAMAWSALAAERNEKRYTEARELIYASLTKEQWDQANVLWRDLKKEYADEVALARAKARWAEVRNGMTGTHTGGVVGHLQIGGSEPGAPSVARVGALADPMPAKPSKGLGPIVAVPSIGGQLAAEVTGANTVEGSTAYRNLRETNNPYDPKFLAVGTATVEQPIGVDEAERAKANAKDKH